MRKSILFVVLVVIAVFSAGCKKKSKIEPSKLMGSLYSGESLQAVQKELNIKPADWEIIEDRRSVVGTSPAWRSLVLVKKNYDGYGQIGDLVLSLFNDELVSVQFYPWNVGYVKQQVASRDGVSFSEAGDAKISVSTRVWVGKDEQGRGYIGWIDKTRQDLRDRAVQ